MTSLGVVAIGLTLARAAWVGTLVAAAVVAFAFCCPPAIGIRRIIFAGFSLFALALGIAAVLGKLFKHASALGRIHIFDVGCVMSAAAQPLGLGLGQIYVRFNEYQATYFSSVPTPLAQQVVAYNTYEVFNSALHAVIEAGWVGATVYLLWAALLVKSSVYLVRTMAPDALTVGATASVTGLLVVKKHY